MDELYGYLPSPSNVSSTTPIPDTTMLDKFTTPIPVSCPSECEGCIGPCSVNSNGGCNCNC
uniref:Uncharacterized protein n=1 Tax=Ciona savignyi TaxID=51511 RepID=H2ZIY9_CIOSA